MNHGTESDAAITTSEAEIAIADMTMRLTHQHDYQHNEHPSFALRSCSNSRSNM